MAGPEADPAPTVPARRGRSLALAAAGYLALALVVWWGVWSDHPTATTTCGCGDSALFLWFFAWPAHALAHGLDPFGSTAMSHPGGVNLLANTSELALGVVLAPVTWVVGPVASMNVALLSAPALSALAMFIALRRWVRWVPAAFCGGLLYGFSPFVLVTLSDAHLMVGWAVIPPLVVACVDELLFGRRRPVRVGLVLGLLLVVQFFVGTEVLLLLGIMAVPAALLLGAYGLRHRVAVRAHARRVATGLVTAGATAGLLLAWPTWYALAGPAHTSGRVWPTLYLGFEGTALKAYLWPTPVSAGFTAFAHRVGGYQGPTLSDQYVGIGMVVVAVVGLAVWRRDRRLWFFGAMTVISVVGSLGASRRVWLPWQAVAGEPVFENIIPSRFLVVTYLCLAVMLGLVVDHARGAFLRRTGGPAGGRIDEVPSTVRWGAGAVGLAVAAVGLVPVATYLAPTVPMVTQPVRSPTWFTTVAPHLAPNQVLLVFPVPYQVIESAMAWQAVAGFPYAMVGGGGPGGVIERTGAERPGAEAIARASYSFTAQHLRPGDVAATRSALTGWRVDTAVLPDQPGLAAYDQVTSVPFTVAFLTAVTGRAPARVAGSWVWARASSDLRAGPGPAPAAVDACVSLGSDGSPAAMERVAACVLAAD
ncbi:MAG TPA: hypothetical protein VIH95_02280 [Acidimicrobiales bacterium]